jgi:hypothetical protein
MTSPPFVGSATDGDGLRCPQAGCDAPLVRLHPGSLRASEWQVLLSCAGERGVRHVSYLTLSSWHGRVRHSLSTHEIAPGGVPRRDDMHNAGEQEVRR